MASATEHAKIVLGAIIPSRRELLFKAQIRLTETHFQDPILQALFILLGRYERITGDVMTEAGLDDALRSANTDAGRSALYRETFLELRDMPVTDSEFAWSVHQLREIQAETATEEAITTGMEILKRGRANEEGEVIRGHTESRTLIAEKFAEIEQEMAMEEAPEGDIRREYDEIMSDYAKRKKMRLEGTSTGIRFGIESLDSKINGLQKGELILSAAFTSHGKTTLCVQLAWSAAVEQGKNVVVLATETTREQFRRKLLSRHSKLPQFNLPDGLNSDDLKKGTLSDAEEVRYQQISTDLTTNPAYGSLYIAQVPERASFSTVSARLNRIQRKMNIDLVVCDYLALLRPDRKRTTAREELSDILKESKSFATSFNGGVGVPFVSPWQISRAAFENAAKATAYTTASLSETAEASNSADVVISLLAQADLDDRYQDITAQILKNRDGQTANGMILNVDYATSWFRSAAGGFSADSLVSVNASSGYGSLLN